MPGRCGRHDPGPGRGAPGAAGAGRLLVDAVRVRAGDLHRAGGDPPGLPAALHAAHVAHQRDLRHRRGRVDRRRRRRLSQGDPHPRRGRALRLHDEHRQRVPHYGPDAEDVQEAMTHAVAQFAAVLATVLFIFSLHWMNDPKTARHAVVAGVTAMLVAVLATWIQPEIVHHGWVALAIVAGFIVGVPLSRVPLTAVPQRTALSHAFGGLAAGLVGVAEYYLWLGERSAQLTPFRMSALVAEVILGFLTFTGSLMAAGKLQEVKWIPQRPVTYPGQNVVNIGVLAIAVALGVLIVVHPTAAWSGHAFRAIAGLALLFGVLLIIPIGGADMPTVISILNSYAGLSAVAVQFAIHPLAGRMPGHMNVLLAEANIPYTALVEMEDINPEMPQCDVALVIGANDVVNPAARYAKDTPIYGMPIIDADKAKTVLAIKRSKNPGFAGIDNELYVQDNTWMLFGDAKTVVGDLVKQLAGGGLH